MSKKVNSKTGGDESLKAPEVPPETPKKTASKTTQKKKTSTATKKTSNPTPEEQVPQMNTTTTNKLNSSKVQQTIQSLEKLQLGFVSAVSELSEKLTLEAAQLQEIQQSVAGEVKQLEELHNLQVADDSLDRLIEQYEQSSKQFQEEFSQRREAVEQDRQEREKAWSKEQEQYKREIKERNDLLAKTRQRDAQEYQYELQLQRQIDADNYKVQQNILYQQLAEIKETKEKEWAEGEKAIAEREKEFAELKAKVEAFPKEKEAAIKRGSDDGKGIASYQAKVKSDLYAKDVEGQKRVYELRFQSLEQTIQNQEARIQSLSKQLEAACKQVQDLAVKAIEGASNLSSSQLLREIALEQAKTLQKAK